MQEELSSHHPHPFYPFVIIRYRRRVGKIKISLKLAEIVKLDISNDNETPGGAAALTLNGTLWSDRSAVCGHTSGNT